MASAQIRRFLILHKELDADDGEVTRTQKVRRGFVAERYAPLINALYDGSREADISTDVTFEDGRKVTLSARVKIRDVETVPVPVLERWHERAMRLCAQRKRHRRARHICARAGVMNSGRHSLSSGRNDGGEGTHEAGRPGHRGWRCAARGRERVARLRRRKGGHRRFIRYPQGRDPRHHRPERRRQDLDAQRHQRLLSAPARPHHLQGQAASAHASLRGGAAAASPARSRTSPCSRA